MPHWISQVERPCDCTAYFECATEGDERNFNETARLTVYLRITDGCDPEEVGESRRRRPGRTGRDYCGLWYPEKKQQYARRKRSHRCTIISQGEITRREYTECRLSNLTSVPPFSAMVATRWEATPGHSSSVTSREAVVGPSFSYVSQFDILECERYPLTLSLTCSGASINTR